MLTLFLNNVSNIIPETFGSCKGVNKLPSRDSLKTSCKCLVQEPVADS